MSNNVLVVGTGTIGRPLLGLLEKGRDQLGIAGLAVHKNRPQEENEGSVRRILSRGNVLLVTEGDRADNFRRWGLSPDLTREEALSWADVVIDCTPAGNAHKTGRSVDKKGNVVECEPWYPSYEGRLSGLIAQGSEEGFGMPYALGINDEPTADQKWIQVVSCNTHNLSVVMAVIRDMGLQVLDSDFVAIRRCTDISQAELIASPKVDKHGDARFGTHHAKDAWRVYQTLDLDLPMFSSSLQTPTQYMHVIRFRVRVTNPPKASAVVDAFGTRSYVALTKRMSAEQIFSEARDCGFHGRILDQTVVVVKTVAVVGDHIVGYCFTPQDGNSLLTSVAAVTRFIDREGWQQRMSTLVSRYHFDWV